MVVETNTSEASGDVCNLFVRTYEGEAGATGHVRFRAYTGRQVRGSAGDGDKRTATVPCVRARTGGSTGALTASPAVAVWLRGEDPVLAVGPDGEPLDPREERHRAPDAAVVGGGEVIVAEHDAAGPEHGPS